MSSIDLQPFFQLGIAGVAIYLIYDLAKKALENLKNAVDNNTKALIEIKEVIQKCKALNNG